MPELAGVQHSPVDDPARVPQPSWPIPYPGMPTGLEQLNAAEVLWWGQRFGIDTPYIWAPSGWGERVLLYGQDLSGIDPSHIIEGVNGPLKP